MSFYGSLFDRVTSGLWKDAGADLQYRLEGDVLLLKCSDSVEDWKHNLMFWWSLYRGKVVHKGFKEVYLKAKPVLDSLKFNLIVGYSFGAGVAHLVHLDRPNTTLITFGSPRVFVTPVKMPKHTRIKNYGDIVSNLPPAWMLYRHTGTEILTSGNIVDLSKLSEIEKASHHHPDEYRQRLRT
jgi:hypothetical protein